MTAAKARKCHTPIPYAFHTRSIPAFPSDFSPITPAMQKVITIGEILVEIMATTPGEGFLEPLSLIGPYPSGAPAIFIDQVAKLGQPAA